MPHSLQLSLKYHPDKNTEEGAADIFMQLGKAYEVSASSPAVVLLR